MQKGIGSLIVAVAFISYGIYCLIKGGTHHKDVGWASKEERPKGFMFAMALYFFIGILSIFYYIFLNFIR
tara:strand:+ start:1028 stop:1237 length:210 start_codon:yes stop_codon:yes gene_type:complete